MSDLVKRARERAAIRCNCGPDAELFDALADRVEENERLREALTGLLGLLTLIRARKDISRELAVILTPNGPVENHRIVAARAAILSLIPDPAATPAGADASPNTAERADALSTPQAGGGGPETPAISDDGDVL